MEKCLLQIMVIAEFKNFFYQPIHVVSMIIDCEKKRFNHESKVKNISFLIKIIVFDCFCFDDSLEYNSL